MYEIDYGMDHWELVWADLNGLFPFDLRDFDAELCWNSEFDSEAVNLWLDEQEAACGWFCAADER